MIGRFRLLARMAAPSDWRKRTGEVETFEAARHMSLPRGERATPTTSIAPFTVLSVSYIVAWARKYDWPEALPHREVNCGCQKRGWFGSFGAIQVVTVGQRSAAVRSQLENAARPIGVASEEAWRW